MGFIKLSYLVPILPLFGAAVNGLFSFLGFRPRRAVVNVIACLSVFAAFIISCGLFYELSLLEPAARSVSITWFTWIDMSVLKANVAFLIDPLSVVMSMVVTGVGFLIHVYSTSYMASDKSYERFFSYLNLFCFAMLVLVLADNLLLMFVGWEGVGLCSYLLIGFWFEYKPNATAGMKAFVVNRIGDFGFLIGLMILFWGLYSIGHPSVTFVEMKENVGLLAGSMIGQFSLITLACVFLFIGAAGKSAQAPLYVWLPDAMAGPTPVSALIHAATMVTAGVYMIGRMNFLYILSPNALLLVAFVGAVTAIFSAIIGFAQNDIKRVLAYSTVSQLGYMFLGMGSAMFTTGIFHLVTHAFFKACLFLGAGSVILGMHHEQDMRKMGGLKRYLPTTFWTFMIATLALAGVFPLAGFFSKDEILWQTFARGDYRHIYYLLWALGVVGAFGTAFYMFRAVSLTFFGQLKTHVEREKNEADALDVEHMDKNLYQPLGPHEQSWPIRYVLVVLAVLSAVGGFIGIPSVIGKGLGIPNFFEMWLEPVFENANGYHQGQGAGGHLAEVLLMVVSLAIVVSGLYIAYYLYNKRNDIVEKLTRRFQFVYKVVENKFYVDEFYDWLFVRRLLWLNDRIKAFDQAVIDGIVNAVGVFGVLWSKVSGWWDEFFVDGAVNLAADFTIASGRKLRRVQTGKIQHYFYVVIAGLIILLVWRIV